MHHSQKFSTHMYSALCNMRKRGRERTTERKRKGRERGGEKERERDFKLLEMKESEGRRNNKPSKNGRREKSWGRQDTSAKGTTTEACNKGNTTETHWSTCTIYQAHKQTNEQTQKGPTMEHQQTQNGTKEGWTTRNTKKHSLSVLIKYAVRTRETTNRSLYSKGYTRQLTGMPTPHVSPNSEDRHTHHTQVPPPLNILPTLEIVPTDFKM